MDIDKMEAGRELVDYVAKDVMHWEKRIGITEVWVDEMGFVQADERWRPDLDISAAWLVEERIAELGLIDEYCWEIIKLASTKKGDPPQQWNLVHATPEDRCRAALKAVDNG